MKQVMLYSMFNRFWHWMQAILIIVLAVTGMEVHGNFNIVGFENAVAIHNFSAWSLIILIAFAVFWHITTGQWRQYIPTSKLLSEMLEYYLIGIFRNAPHPTKKSELSKLNPLQRLTYLFIKILALPVQIVTGALYYYYNNLADAGSAFANLEWIAVVHTISSYSLIMFIIIHVYLTSTGHTLTSNLKAMITGWEEVDE
ncbi:MAG: cytochrome b/b6 domain-containing protein [Candidatus Marinimicrobia bacterium]|nr:cytochrome b/b6 domain-containing protein [Candidatus Neomarinimicrobiota bacterium]